ncbi:MAG: hypothetical protein B6D40_04720 [Anaerolineae bacterium UTCFX3]|nr:MAG: hypothetical protein B6D40_04720 [Anaerolineae bacterium UTCFX3]
MITEINETNLNSIRNPVFRSQAERYAEIYRDFIGQVRQLGMDFADEDRSQQIHEHITTMGKKAIRTRRITNASVGMNATSQPN